MKSVSKGILWSGIETFGVQGMSFVISMVIARLVAPEAYGLIAMINVFISFFQIFVSGGFSSALIQKIDREDIDYYTAFIANLTVALVLYLIMFFGAPLIAHFYDQLELTSMIRWISLTLILQSLTLVQKTRLNILLDFKTQAISSLISLISGAVIGITLAFHGYEVWALISQTLVSQSVACIALAISTKWIPKITFSVISFKTLFSFGSKDLTANFFTSFYININNLIIGKFYSPASLAFYNRGFSTGFLPANLWTNTFSRISYPVLCENQNNRDALLSEYYRFLSLGSYVMFPVMFIISIYASPIIKILLTERWLPTVPYLQIMCFVFILYPMNLTMVQVINAVGHPEKNLKALVWKRLASFLALIASVPFGVKWIAIGVFISTCIEVIIASYVSANVLDISILSQFKSLIKPLIACVIIASIGKIILIVFNQEFFQIIIGMPLCAGIYLILTYILRMPEKEYINKFIYKLKLNGE